jgi:hypothetical protein
VSNSSTDEPDAQRSVAPPTQKRDLANEVERAHTPRTPGLALAGVWLVVAAAFLLVLLVVGLTLYFVS